MSADPHGQGTTGRPHPDDDLDALVRGLGALLGWQVATYAVIGDLHEVVPAINEEIKRRRA